ncbi:MAG: polyprenyl synthetase family protein [Campylobacterales bacterium]|nr:polyprenyl synthetase family protein [Campylobacterales bacterium]
MDNFEQYLMDNLPKAKSFHPHYEEALGKMLIAGGKRFRPKLVFAVVESYEPLLLENSYPVALGIEMLHTYSLIHDDLPVMDDSDLRRGNPTLHKVYDEVTAVLVGDALNTEAFNQVANAPLNGDVVVKLVKTLAEYGGTRGMVLGQAIDCHFENELLTIEQLEFLHSKKTGVLIAGSLKMGAIIAGLDLVAQEKIFNLGLKLGLLFQIQDDIIDATQTAEEAGKPTGNDEDKNTFTNLLGVDGAVGRKNELIEEINSDLAGFNEKFRENLMGLVKKYLV